MSISLVLDYAALGFQVFPLRPESKEPATKRGFYEATNNPATLRRWFAGSYPYNIGIRTGIASGAWVFDVDGEAGVLSLAKLEAEHGQLPPTLISITSGGCHFWFKAVEPIPGSIGKIGPGLDVKAEHGYVVAPPSIHPDGPIYRWSNSRPIAAAPAWLVKLAQQARRKADAPALVRPVSSLKVGAYARGALEREVSSVATAIPGTRNHTLNRASFSLHQLVAAGALDRGEVEQRLFEAAHSCGLLQEDGKLQCLATIRSGARAGLQHPRVLS
jgi:hypothetical protein